MVETPMIGANTYAAFATSNQCGAIDFAGHVSTDSYNSNVGPPSTTTMSTGGDVGTNGNLTVTGNGVNIGGTLYVPQQGIGSCTDGATGATVGYTGPTNKDGTPTAVNGIVQRPAVNFPAPTFSTTPPTNTVEINSALLANPSTACSSLGLTLGSTCTISGTTVTVNGGGTPVTMPSVQVANGYTLVFQGSNPPSVININSLSGSAGDGNGSIQVAANMTSPSQDQAVVLKIAGTNPDGTQMASPLDLNALSWKQNSTVPQAAYDAQALQIVYGGTGTLTMAGNDQAAATIYAPNATVSLKGTADFYGSILAATISNSGTPAIHYDRALANAYFVMGNPMLGTFSWKRF